jgi:hypothetical protein
MDQSKLVHHIQEFGSFVIGAAFSSALSYGVGLGNWLRTIQPLFLLVVIIWVGVWFYFARIKRVTYRGRENLPQ